MCMASLDHNKFQLNFKFRALSYHFNEIFQARSFQLFIKIARRS